MAKKFVATAGTKEEYDPIEEYQKARNNREARMLELEGRIDGAFEELAARYKTVHGAATVADMFNQLGSKWSTIQVQRLSNGLSTFVSEMYADYSMLKDKVAETDTFLDQYVDNGWVDNPQYTKEDMCFELCKMSVIQEVWEAIRKLPEFYNATQPELDKLMQAAYEENTDGQDD